MRYWPRSGLRLHLLLLLAGAWPGSLSISELAEATPGASREAVRKALHDLVSYGVVERVARGLYKLNPEFRELLTSLESYKRLRKVTYVSSLKGEELVERVKRFVKERYGGALDEVDLAVVEALARVALESSSPYVVDASGRGLAAVLKERSGGILSGYSEAEIAESLKHLEELGVVYVNKRYRKVRLDVRIMELAGWPR